MVDKNTLLNLGIFIDNLFLEKYIELLNNNLDTKYEKHKYQKHHTIPVSYYKTKYKITDDKKARKKADEDLNNCKINLLFKDHLLAHYYLYFCLKDDYLKYASANMLTYWNNRFEKISYKEFIESLPDYQLIYQKLGEWKSLRQKSEKSVNYGKKYKMKDETKLKISQANKGKKRSKEICEKLSIQRKEYYKNNPKKGIKHSEETKNKLSNTWKNKFLNGYTVSPVSEENKKNLSKLVKGSIYIFKEGLLKRIRPEELPTYESQGWVKGNPKQKERMLGKKLSEETRLKMKNSAKHFEWLTSEQRSLQGKLNKGRIHIHKDNEHKMIFESDLTYYIEQGWKKGRGKIK